MYKKIAFHPQLDKLIAVWFKKVSQELTSVRL